MIISCLLVRCGGLLRELCRWPRGASEWSRLRYRVRRRALSLKVATRVAGLLWVSSWAPLQTGWDYSCLSAAIFAAWRRYSASRPSSALVIAPPCPAAAAAPPASSPASSPAAPPAAATAPSPAASSGATAAAPSPAPKPQPASVLPPLRGGLSSGGIPAGISPKLMLGILRSRGTASPPLYLGGQP